MRPNRPQQGSPRSSRGSSAEKGGSAGHGGATQHAISGTRGRKRMQLAQAPARQGDGSQDSARSRADYAASVGSSRASSADPLEPWEESEEFGRTRPGGAADHARRSMLIGAGSHGGSPTQSYSPYRGISPSGSFSSLGKPFDLRSTKERAIDDELESNLDSYFNATANKAVAATTNSVGRASPPIPHRNRSPSPTGWTSPHASMRTPSPTPRSTAWGGGTFRNSRGTTPRAKGEQNSLPRSQDLEDMLSQTPWTHGETKMQRGT